MEHSTTGKMLLGSARPWNKVGEKSGYFLQGITLICQGDLETSTNDQSSHLGSTADAAAHSEMLEETVELSPAVRPRLVTEFLRFFSALTSTCNIVSSFPMFNALGNH